MKVGDEVIWTFPTGSSLRCKVVGEMFMFMSFGFDKEVPCRHVEVLPGQMLNGSPVERFASGTRPWTMPEERATVVGPVITIARDAREPQDLNLVGAGKGWKISYSRLEQLIERGYVNATGASLTEAGAKRAKEA